MADIVITDQAIRLTVEGTVNAGEVVADLRPSAITADALLKAQNLADLTSAAMARTNLGSTTVGDAVFVAASTTIAQTALGATSIGRSLFTAASASAARGAIVANILPESLHFDDVSAATAMVRYYSFGILSGFLTDILVVLDGPLLTGDLTLGVEANGVSVAGSFASLTVPQAGSAAGTLGWFPAIAGIVLNSASVIKVTILGANTATVGATIVVKVNY